MGNLARPSRKRLPALIAGTVVAVLFVGILLALSDIDALRERAASVSVGWLVFAAVAALLSHAFIGLCQRELLAALGHALPVLRVMRDSFVSVVISRNLRSGGASGLAFMGWRLAELGVPFKAVASMGVGQLLMTNALFIVMLLGGAIFMVFTRGPLPKGLLVGYLVAAGVLGALTAAAWLLITSERARKRWSKRLGGAVAFVVDRKGKRKVASRLASLLDSVTTAVKELAARPGDVTAAWVFSVLRVAASFAALAGAIAATQIELTVPIIVLTFCATKLAASATFVPAGIGVQDASVTGMLTAFGAPYEAALLAALCHRATYHVVPALVALPLAVPLMRSALRRGGRDSPVAKASRDS